MYVISNYKTIGWIEAEKFRSQEVWKPRKAIIFFIINYIAQSNKAEGSTLLKGDGENTDL